MNDIQGVVMILAILLATYLLARTVALMVYRLVRKKPWVGKVLWWTTLLCGVAALFGPRHGSIFSSFAVLGMTVLLLHLVGKVLWGKPREDFAHEDSEPIKTPYGPPDAVQEMLNDWKLHDPWEGFGFYTSLGDAMAHGASVNTSGTDDGPGYYV